MLEWNKRWASVLECADLSHDQQRSLTPPLREHAQQTERKTLADEWEDQWMKTYRKGTPMLPFHNWIESFVGSTSTAGWALKSHSYIFAGHHLGRLFWFHIPQGCGNEKRTIWVLLLVLFVQTKRVNIHYSYIHYSYKTICFWCVKCKSIGKLVSVFFFFLCLFVNDVMIGRGFHCFAKINQKQK